MKLVKLHKNEEEDAPSSSPIWVVIVLGVLMIALGLTSIIKMSGLVEGDIVYNAYPIMVMAGIIVLYERKKPAGNIVLVTGIFIALTSIYQNLAEILANPNTSMAQFVLAIGFDFVLIICSISYYIGNRHNSWRLVILAIIAVVANVFNLFTHYILEAMSLADSINIGLEDIEAVLVCAVFVFYLMQPGVKEDSIGVKLREGISALEQVSVSGPGITITESSLKCMTGEDRSAWTTFEDGPVAMEGSSEMRDGKVVYKCTSRIWRGEDIVRVSLERDSKEHTYGQGFDICSVAYTEDESSRFVHLFGTDGKFVKIRVTDDSEGKSKLLSRLKRRKDGDAEDSCEAGEAPASDKTDTGQ